jgi:hypothetical protein
LDHIDRYTRTVSLQVRGDRRQDLGYFAVGCDLVESTGSPVRHPEKRDKNQESSRAMLAGTHFRNRQRPSESIRYPTAAARKDAWRRLVTIASHPRNLVHTIYVNSLERSFQCHRYPCWVSCPKYRRKCIMTASEVTTFACPTCGAKYKLVRIEAEPDLADRPITCRKCGGPLHGREGRFILKYILVELPKPGARRQR